MFRKWPPQSVRGWEDGDATVSQSGVLALTPSSGRQFRVKLPVCCGGVQTAVPSAGWRSITHPAAQTGSASRPYCTGPERPLSAGRPSRAGTRHGRRAGKAAPLGSVGRRRRRRRSGAVPGRLQERRSEPPPSAAAPVHRRILPGDSQLLLPCITMRHADRYQRRSDVQQGIPCARRAASLPRGCRALFGGSQGGASRCLV